MKIWRLADPFDYRFARAARRGAWSTGTGPCAECGAASQERVKPLILEWESGGETLGDFSWPGFGDNVAVTERVREHLNKHSHGFDFGPVEITGPRLPRVSQKRAAFQGENELAEIWVRSCVDMDPGRSTAWLVKRCAVCGREQYMLEDVERDQTEWDTERKELVRHRFARRSGRGLYVAQQDLDGASIFRVRQLPSWILCADDVKDSIEARSFTNIDFLEVGEVI